MKESRGTVLIGLALATTKLALLPFQRSALAPLLSSLTDFLLTLLLSVAAWRASRRSFPFARFLWLGIACAFTLESLSFGAGIVLLASSSIENAWHNFWPLTILFYLIGVAFAAPLLLSEDQDKPRITWLRLLDVAQVGILTLSAYLIFFYIPAITGFSNQAHLRNFTFAHLMRDGLLALGFLYRGLQSRFPDLRRLQLRLSAFFAAFGASSILYFAFLNVWHWPEFLADFLNYLPVLFLLQTAVTWRQEGEMPGRREAPEPYRSRFWAQFFPAIVPLTVVALSSRISSQHLRGAWAAITLSFLCYAARLWLMQRQQDIMVARLYATEEKFSKAFQSSPVAICISRLQDGKFIAANDHYLDLLKLSREEVLGRTSLDLEIFENAAERNKLLVDEIQKQGSLHSLPFKFRVAGRTIDTLVSAELVQLEGETLVISSILDVSELKSITQQLHEAQKMELVGTLAGGVAHDFNNLLTVIKGYAQMALKRDLQPDLAQEMQQISEATDRAAALTQQLLAFSRRQLLQPRNIDLNQIVAGVEKILRRTIGENIELVVSLAKDLGTVYADPTQIEQVLMNLAINSRDSMPNGGTLLFESRNLELTAPYTEECVEIPSGRYVMLTVADTGTGIEPQFLERIFEPFFTTKEPGRGTGLGLSTVYGIVKQSGGYVWPYSRLGLGTTFKICLPRVDQPAEEITPTTHEARHLAGTQTVLVAEDDRHVRDLVTSVLRQAGYRVISADSGEEALRRACEFESEIHLLVTDIIMPGANGGQLLQRLEAVRPRLKVLYISGYPYHSRSNQEAVDFRESLLAKPFAPSDLLREVHEALNRPNQTGAKAKRRKVG